MGVEVLNDFTFRTPRMAIDIFSRRPCLHAQHTPTVVWCRM